jgi:hypothetical protein
MYKLDTTICITCSIFSEIECNKFVCNEFVLVIVRIDLIQFVYSNCIISICIKFDTNLLHTNLLLSILRKNQSRNTNCSTPAKKNSCLKKMVTIDPQVHGNT